ncbi:hypothetical protein Bca52824_017355 [Brassica carinata]|uniref:Uncharacterized protein n=1 Tax=Brassica carinata TaxID=52824 RepID=A0A8X7VNG5_BRACI|nr:hypothetical protein Bca52824_017355 [Brassica carinata]
MVLEDSDMEEDSLADLELSYLPTELINTSTCPPVIIANDRQLQNFVGFVKKSVSTRLCLTAKAKAENPNEQNLILTSSQLIQVLMKRRETRLGYVKVLVTCFLESRSGYV